MEWFLDSGYGELADQLRMTTAKGPNVGSCGRLADPIRYIDGIKVRMRNKSVHGFEPDMVDRKSTRLNSSHDQISYAVFCLKKKKTHDLVARDLPSRAI